MACEIMSLETGRAERSRWARRLAAQLSALRCYDATPAPAAAAEPDDEGPVTDAVRRQYDERGFVVIDGLVSQELAARLLEATERVTAAARAVGGAAGEGGGGLAGHSGPMHSIASSLSCAPLPEHSLSSGADDDCADSTVTIVSASHTSSCVAEPGSPPDQL